jgi:hypothetical protein
MKGGKYPPPPSTTTTTTTQSNGGVDSEKMGGSGGGSSAVSKPKLVFHCQQAQGSPTGLISGFSNVKELYQKIADCYDFTVDDVRFFIL